MSTLREPIITGEQCRKWRKEKGWTQEELARRCGLNMFTISRMERGRQKGTGPTQRVLLRALQGKDESSPSAPAAHPDITRAITFIDQGLRILRGDIQTRAHSLHNDKGENKEAILVSPLLLGDRQLPFPYDTLREQLPFPYDTLREEEYVAMHVALVEAPVAGGQRYRDSEVLPQARLLRDTGALRHKGLPDPLPVARRARLQNAP